MGRPVLEFLGVINAFNGASKVEYVVVVVSISSQNQIFYYSFARFPIRRFQLIYIS